MITKLKGLKSFTLLQAKKTKSDLLWLFFVKTK